MSLSQNGHSQVAFIDPPQRALARTTAPTADPDRLEQRLRLIGDLAEALTKQIAKVRTDLETAGPSTPLMHQVSEQQGLVRDAVEQLGNLQSLVRSNAAPSRSEADYLRRQPSAISVALELRLDGMSRPEVERFLEDNFRVRNAPEIGLFVFGSQSGQPGFPRPPKRLPRRWRFGRQDPRLLPP